MRPRLVALAAVAALAALAPSVHAGRVFRANFLAYRNPPGLGWSAVAADLDGDGRAELISTSANGPLLTLNIRAGLSGGVLSSAVTTIPIGGGGDLAPYIEVEDVDGDGRDDIVLSASDSVFVLRNLGGGALAAPVRLYVPGALDGEVAVGDVNGDGRADLVVLLPSLNQAAILYGTGGLGFAPGPVLTTHNAPVHVGIADLDENGIPDILVGADTSTVFVGLGGGSFSPVDVPGTDALVAGDLDRDGHVDLVDNSDVRLGHGDGTFGAPIPHGMSLPWLTADLNEDGLPDLVGVSTARVNGAWTIPVRRGAGGGHFGAEDEQIRFNDSFTVSAGDLDGDGHLDLVSNGFNTPYSFAMYGNGTGEFDRAITIPVPDPPAVVAVGNLGGDPHLDLVSGGRSHRTVSVLLSQNAAQFAVPVSYPTPFGVKTLRTVDLNGDGRDDVVADYDSTGVLSVWLTQSDGSLGTRVDLALPAAGGAIAVGDVNVDGKADLVVNTGVGTSIFFGNGNGTFQPRADLASGLATDVRIADLNGDGWPDLVGMSPTGTHGPRVLLATAPGVFGSPVDYPGPSASPRAIVVGKFDADANPDVIYAANSVYLFRGTGGGALGSAQLLSEVPGGVSLFETADFDGDGKLDIVMRALGQVLGLQLGHGDGSFDPRVGYGTGISSTADGYAVGDVDGNGRLDLVSADELQGSLSILLNQTLAPAVGVPRLVAHAGALAVSAMPNPLRGRVRLALSFPRAGAASVELFDVNGRRLARRELPEAAAGPLRLTLGETGGLPPGLYFIHVRQGAEVSTARVCMMR